MSVRNRALLTLAIFVLALVPRALPTPFHTTDEMDKWIARSRGFLHALQTADYSSTVQAYHPGVLTLWLSSGGILLTERVTGTSAEAMSLVPYLPLLRAPSVLVHAAAIALAYALMLRRLFGERVALLAALLWATNPFHVAHSQVLHVDSLSTTFVTWAFLAGLVAFHADDEPQTANVRWTWLVVSAVFAGLASLTKLTMLYVSAPLGLAALEMREAWFRQPNRWYRLLCWVVLPMAAWTGVVFVTWFVLYPALWANPVGVIQELLYGSVLATSPHGGGNYFWGQVVDDPGRWFYWVAIAMRITPWVFIGTVAGFVRAFRGGWRGRAGVVALLGFSVGFILLMTLQAKKFDRYMLPIFLALDIVAAVGLLWLTDLVARLWARVRRIPPWVGWGTAVLAMVGTLVWYAPYLLAYYNPLFGGSRTANYVMNIGWGEGLNEAVGYMRAHHLNCEDEPVIMVGRRAHFAHYDVDCVDLVPYWDSDDIAQTADFVVTYVADRQRGETAIFEQQMLQAGKAPLYTVRLHGIDYVYIYDVRDTP